MDKSLRAAYYGISEMSAIQVDLAHREGEAIENKALNGAWFDAPKQTKTPRGRCKQASRGEAEFPGTPRPAFVVKRNDASTGMRLRRRAEVEARK
jgi:hypothetical protein